MTARYRMSIVLLAGLTMGAVSAAPVRAQTSAPEPPRWSFIDYLPGLSIGLGVGSVGTEGTPRWSTPRVTSVRVAPTPHVLIEAEWTQRMRGSTFSDTGDIGLSTLNGQTGIYGRATHASQYEMKFASLSVLARTEMGRLSFLGGVGIGDFDWTQDSVATRTGCTGPWVAACESGNGQSRRRQLGRTLVVLGSIEINVLPRVDAFISGRIGGSNDIEEGAIVAGIRGTVLPYPRALRRQPADSLMNGLVIGLLGGAAAGIYVERYDEPRTLPAAMLAGMALGALIDLLNDRK
jgi:hypothetical protein